MDPDPVLHVWDLAVVISGLVGIGAGIMRSPQDAVDAAVEKGTATQSVALAIQPGGNRPGAHRLAIKTDAGKLVNAPDDQGFIFADEQLAAFLLAIDGDSARLVAERDLPTVEIAVAGIGAPVTPCEHRSVVRVLLVDDGNHVAHHLAIGIIPEPLGQGDKLDTGLGQLVLCYNLGHQATRKSRQGIDNYQLHRALGAGCLGDHPVEFAALEPRPRDADVGEEIDDLDPFPLGIGDGGIALARDGGVIAIFFIDADPRVAKGFQLHLGLGHYFLLALICSPLDMEPSILGAFAGEQLLHEIGQVLLDQPGLTIERAHTRRKVGLDVTLAGPDQGRRILGNKSDGFAHGKPSAPSANLESGR